MTDENTTPVHAIVMWLERIGVALESIAERAEVTKPATPSGSVFPWREVSVRTRRRLRDAVTENRWHVFDEYTWPLSCEDLVELGAERLLNDACIRQWGNVSAAEVGMKLSELGFSYNWLDA